jgi:hypothetical protein
MDAEMKLLEAQLADQQKAARATADRLEALRKADEAAKLEPLKATADRAHHLLCPYNHTDGCSWGYEEGSAGAWQSDAHSRWLRKMNTLVNGDSYTAAKTNLAEINLVLDAVEAVKAKVPTALDLIRRGLAP